MDPEGRTKCGSCDKTFMADQLVEFGGRMVCGDCKQGIVMDMKSGVPAGRKCPPETAEIIRRRILKLNLLSFASGTPGILLMLLPAMLGPPGLPFAPGPTLLMLLGSLLFSIGLVFNAQMKGRSNLWALFGLLSCLGLIILEFVQKICHFCHARQPSSKKECTNCGAPL